MDELWSFVDNKGNQQLWLAFDAQTREIVGVQMVDRSAVSEECFMEFNATSLPSIGSNLYRSLECWEMLYCPVNVIVVVVPAISSASIAPFDEYLGW